MKHFKNCNWEKANCSYKESHFYCPHPEHACNCEELKPKHWLNSIVAQIKEEEHNKTLNPIAERILNLSKKINIKELSLRKIGKEVGLTSPTHVRHHLYMLIKKGLLNI